LHEQELLHCYQGNTCIRIHNRIRNRSRDRIGFQSSARCLPAVLAVLVMVIQNSLVHGRWALPASIKHSFCQHRQHAARDSNLALQGLVHVRVMEIKKLKRKKTTELQV